MRVYRPIRTNRISQKFGQNNACCKVENGKPVRPFKVVVKQNNTCPVGYTEFYPSVGLRGHNGTDYMAYSGENIYFNVDAETKWYAKTEVDLDGGVGIRVCSLDPISLKREDLPPQMSQHAMSYYESQGGKIHVSFLYWHLKDVHLADKPKVQVGVFANGQPELLPEIKIGDLIGFADNTGASSGDHLHHAMKFISKNSMTVGGDNGYTGAVDMDKWFENLYVLDVVEDVKERALSAIQYANWFLFWVRQFLKK